MKFAEYTSSLDALPVPEWIIAERYMYCDNCRFNSEINKEDSDEWSCDDCHRKYNGWGISMQTSRRIAKDILESIRE